MAALRRREAVRNLIAYAEDLGFTYSHTNGGHIKFSKVGAKPVFCSSSCSDWRGYKNAQSDLRRAAQIENCA